MASMDVLPEGSDLESPVRAIKRKRCLLIASDPSSDESADFAEQPRRAPGDATSGSKEPRKGGKWEGECCGRAKDFLDDEAEVSAEGAAEVSSDESLASEDELSSSLVQFAVDSLPPPRAFVTGGLASFFFPESEMQAVYLKSVRSPALGNRYKMVHKRPSLRTVFSQVPEPEESYVADSFCVEDHEEGEPPAGGSSEAESEECVDFDLLQEEESFVDGRKRYNTRHRRKRREGGQRPPAQPGRPSRVCLLSSSSEEEEEGGPRGVPPIPDAGRTSARDSPLPALDHSLPQRATCPPPPAATAPLLPLELQAGLSEGLDFLPEGKGHGQQERLPRALQEEPGRGSPPSMTTMPGRPAALCVLADSREVASGPEVISALKAAHGVKVQVCSLGGCDYVVSPRLAVERTRPAELMNGAQQSRAVQRVQQLKRTFDRICVIVEKERPKAGEAWRAFHRTKRYDSLLSAFVRAGIRVLFSSGQEETAGLLAELVLVEQRKAGASLAMPTEAEGPKRDAFQFYLSIPGVSYPLALAFCHHFGSVREMVNSSPSEIAARAQVTRQKAEEVHRYIHYGFEAQMLPGVLT
ncbi:hypothetical protein JRQ81_001297 [Phrynocephalus forsythii]|uniref:ERCC4 domain-containing protein n=1 Tax=Phrynocephalus forsythii TaxID=171643 RepID=A0A9Q1B8A0_9SAUR|nr:hypothetical protein JRQ81_001297 [Phrynocephalus forsythii]